MDHVLDAHFRRVDAALGTLVDSIAAFNPSTHAALDLVSADDQLTRGLDHLARHQDQHARILALRAESAALDAELKSSVKTLADLRAELHHTPATTFSEDSRPVKYDDLVRYANYISKHTVPPTYREPLPKKADDKDKEHAGPGDAPSNGVGTPALAPPPPPGEATAGQDPEALQHVTAEEAEWLKKLKDKGQIWYPWPSDDKIRFGNLMAIQSLLDKGLNPQGRDARPNLEQMQQMQQQANALEEEKRRQDAADAHAQAQEQQREERRESAVEGQALAHAHAQAERPAEPQAQFTGFDYDEDDDDD